MYASFLICVKASVA